MTKSSLFNVLTGIACICIPLLAIADSDDVFRDKLIKLGTARESGVFFPLGQHICSEVNLVKEKTLVRCVALPTGGTDYNIQSVSVGGLQVGFSYTATTKFPFPENTRKVINLYKAPITVLVRANLNINQPSDLRGKRVNVGSPTSNIRTLSKIILDTAQLKVGDLTPVKPFEVVDGVEGFCKNEFDVFIAGLSIPNPFYDRIVKECGGQYLTLSPAFADAAIALVPGLEKQTYKVKEAASAEPRDFLTVGQDVCLISSSNVDPEALRRFTLNLAVALKKLSQSEPLVAGWNENYGYEPSSQLTSIPKPVKRWGEK
jgi:TRAP transporter TAXI family solute receptor